jgi:Ca2+-binding EF-hand superfamily protein
MTSTTPNKLSNQTKDKFDKTSQKRCEKLLELISAAITSKHHQLSRAFKVFDQHNRMRVSFNDFIDGLDALNVRISTDDAKQVFCFLDTKNFKYLTLDQFTALYDC